MNIHDMCITAAFMWEGVHEDNTLLAHCDQGSLELCSEVTQYAELSEMYLTAAFTVIENDFPGVYDYEVSEPFGKWCRGHLEAQMLGPIIDKRDASAKLAEMVYDFFIVKCGKDHNLDLQAALKAVRNHWLETRQ